MNVAHNFHAVADAPLTTTTLQQLLAVLFAADKPLAVTSKYVKGRRYTTTVYDPATHTLVRAFHNHGCRVLLKALAKQNPHIQLLGQGEAVSLEAAPVSSLAH